MKKKYKTKALKNSQINSPHDRIFRIAMKVPELAHEFLTMHLPTEITNNIKSLELLPDTFLDETLSRSQVDALFKATYKDSDLLI